MKFPVLVLLSVFLLSASCKKKNKKCSRSYILEHPVSVYPIKENYQVGDTLWIEMNFSDIFNSIVTNNIDGETFQEEIQLRNWDFHRNFLRVLKLVDSTKNVNEQPTGTWNSSFTPIYVIGNFIQELPDGPEYKLSYYDGYYKLKQGLILKNKGRYLFYPKYMLNFSVQSSQNNQDITTSCEKEIITDIRFPINKQVNGTYFTNYHLFLQFMNPSLEPDTDRIKYDCFSFIVN